MKHISITEQELIAIRDVIAAITTSGDGCFKVVGVINLLNKLLSREVSDGIIHPEQPA